MADYKTYLAQNLVGDDKVITYRLLSRALKVHINNAKEMLYEFHRLQNAKKPGTIHATYLLSGTKRAEEQELIHGAKDGEDEYMQSSPFVGGSKLELEEASGACSVLTITLVGEENLESIRSQYDHISSIHIYSIGPHPLKDLHILSDSSREIINLTASEDPVESLAQYGTISNPNVKRRPNRRPPVAAPVPQAAKPKVEEAKEPVKVKAEPKLAPISNGKEFFGKGKEKPKGAEISASSSKEGTPNPPNLKRENSSLFKSFAKAKPRIKKEETDSSAVVSATEDSPMKDVSDDEEETYEPEVASEAAMENDRKKRKEREAALKQMMEDDDDDDDTAPTPEPEPEEEQEAEVLEEIKDEEPKPDAVEVKEGRRRGRRRVMKKKNYKDEEGYLVTREEAVWESFSEDETVPKPKPKASAAPAALKGGKKPATKPGQGNIMSFFGKK